MYSRVGKSLLVAIDRLGNGRHTGELLWYFYRLVCFAFENIAEGRDTNGQVRCVVPEESYVSIGKLQSWWNHGKSHQVPPTPGLLSNTRIVSKACSFANASVVIAPEGPAPITATRRALRTITKTSRCERLKLQNIAGESLLLINVFRYRYCHAEAILVPLFELRHRSRKMASSATSLLRLDFGNTYRICTQIYSILLEVVISH